MEEMIFTQHPLFDRTAIRSGLLSEEDMRELREWLKENPGTGDALGASLYKIRVAAKGKGKRGGARVIYLWRVSKNHIAFLLAFPKNERENITKKELELLKSIAKAEE